MTRRRRRRHVPPAPLPPPGRVPIDVSHAQEQDNWCWAACIQAVLSSRNTQMNQCALADAVPRLGGGCCAAALPAACDDGLQPAEITTLLQRSLPTAQQNGALTVEVLTTEVTSGRPVIVGYDWGHVCVVYGLENNKFLFYNPLGPATGKQTFRDISNFGPGSQTWSFSWTGL